MNRSDMCPPGPKHLVPGYNSLTLSSLAVAIVKVMALDGGGSHEVGTAWIPKSPHEEEQL